MTNVETRFTYEITASQLGAAWREADACHRKGLASAKPRCAAGSLAELEKCT